MKTLATVHRKAVNQAAHAAALRFEMETRERWIRELTEALEAGASFQELREKLEQLARAKRVREL
jgi:truncated hemoglobin YjbI